MSSLNYTFDNITNIASITMHPALPKVDIIVPDDIVQFNKIKEYISGFVMPPDDILRLYLLEEAKPKTVMYVLPNTLMASPMVISILNKCNELYPVRFKWTSDINDTSINNCFYDYRFNEEFVGIFNKFNLTTRKIILKLQNKSTFNEILRTTNLDFLRKQVVTPHVLSLKTPKNIKDINTFFGASGTSYIIKPIYGFQSNTRIYDRKQYTTAGEFISDIIRQHGSVDTFFEMQNNENNFVWSEKTKNDTPVFIQQVIPVQGVYTCYSVYSNGIANVKIIPKDNTLPLEYSNEVRLNELIKSVMYLNRLMTTFVTINVILSNNDFYFTDLSESMYPLLSGDGPNKDITDLAKILFSVLSE